MPERTKAATKVATTKPIAAGGAPKLTPVSEIPANATLGPAPKIPYKYRYTTGLFLLPHNAGSLDWAIVNDDVTAQAVRVTVYSCPVGAPKHALPPGPLVVTVPSDQATHNANTYPNSGYFEVVVECNSQLVFPYVSIWPANFGEVIPGCGINAGTFVRTMP